MTDSKDQKKPLGRILLRQRSVTQPDLDRALAEASGDPAPLATRLTEAGALSEIDALKALSEQSGVPGIDLAQICIRLRDLEIVPQEVAERHKLLPVLVRDDRVFVAMAAPTDTKVIDEIEFVTGKRVFPYIALSGPLMRVIGTAYEMKRMGETHFVGARCPLEVQQKAGVTSPRLEEGGFSRPLAPPQTPPPPLRQNDIETGPRARAPGGGGPLVVDDAMGRMAVADELTDADFGTAAADRDLSVVAELPTEFPKALAGQRTLLVVDDEPEIRRLVRRVFEDRKYRVLEADRGDVAMRILKETMPDAIILDAMLPEVHGFDIARRIKGSERFRHIPIVMISAVYKGWRYAEDVKTSYGVDEYLEKPFRVADVVMAVEKAIERHGRESRPPTEDISSEAERLLAEGIAAYKRGDIGRAIEQLREGTRLDPLAYRLHFHLGLLYGKKGQVYDAIQALEAALHINGRHFAALKNLAVLYQQAGLRNKAIEMWERALTVAPDDPTRQSIKEHLLGLL